MGNQGEMAHIEMTKLKECRIQLRPVDKRTVEYRELKDSIQQHGLWQPILVRPSLDGVFEVVDGFYRYNCCRDLRHQTVPCLIRKLTDREVLIVQIQTNAVRLETDPIDFARQIWRIIRVDGEMTVGQMAHLLKKSPLWVRKMLNMNRLCDTASTAVQRGRVTISVAHELSKFPPKLQRELLPQAVVIPAKEFLPIIKARIRQFKRAIKTGHMEDYYGSMIEPVPYLRGMTELYEELKVPSTGAELLARTKAKTPMDGWRLCLDWVVHLDPDSVEEQKKKLSKRYREEEKQAELRKKDRERMKLEERSNDE